MKKHTVICFLLILLLFIAGNMTVLAENTAVVEIQSKTTDAGESLELEVNITGNPGMAAWMFELSWDTSAISLYDY